MAMTMEVELITPEKAKFWLENCNSKNRNINDRLVNSLAKEMLADKMKLNGETIKFAKSGKLLDGQHRLSACVKSGAPFRSVVVRGLFDDVFDTIDTGAKRTSSQILAVDGFKNAAVLSGAARYAKTLETDPVPRHLLNVSATSLRDYIYDNPELCDSVLVGRLAGALCSNSMMGALHFLLAKRDRELAGQFIRDVVKGAGLPSHSPELMLRNKFLDIRMNKRKNYGPIEQCAMVIRAWNAVRQHRNIGILRGLVENSTFPKIV